MLLFVGSLWTTLVGEMENLLTVQICVSPEPFDFSLIASLMKSIQPLIPGSGLLLLILIERGTIGAAWAPETIMRADDEVIH